MWKEVGHFPKPINIPMTLQMVMTRIFTKSYRCRCHCSDLKLEKSRRRPDIVDIASHDTQQTTSRSAYCCR